MRSCSTTSDCRDDNDRSRVRRARSSAERTQSPVPGLAATLAPVGALREGTVSRKAGPAVPTCLGESTRRVGCPSNSRSMPRRSAIASPANAESRQYLPSGRPGELRADTSRCCQASRLMVSKNPCTNASRAAFGRHPAQETTNSESLVAHGNTLSHGTSSAGHDPLHGTAKSRPRAILCGTVSLITFLCRGDSSTSTRNFHPLVPTLAREPLSRHSGQDLITSHM
jgi:hypothetical protein